MRNIIIISIISCLLSLNSYSFNNDPKGNEVLDIITDRELYSIGEKIWFTAFILNQKTTESNKIGYIELITPNNISIARKKILISELNGNGVIEIPDTLSSGHYKLLFYTSKVKQEWNTEYSKIKNLFIYNPEKERCINGNEIHYSLENNNLIADFENIIYIANYDVTQVEIVNEKDSSIHTSKNVFLNAISFKPRDNRTYFLVSNKKKIKLPVINSSGAIFNLTKIRNNYVAIQLQANKGFVNNNKGIVILDQDKNKLKEYQAIDTNMTISFELNSNIREIQVLNAYGKILWERKLNNYFLSKARNLDVELSNNNFKNREQVELKLINKSNLITSNISVSVSKISNSQINSTPNNPSDLYLLSNINLLFNEQIDDNEQNHKRNEINGGLISGKLIESNNTPFSNTNVFLTQVDSVSLVRATKTDENGNFHFNIYPSSSFVDIVINPNINKNTTLFLKDQFLNTYNKFYSIDYESVDTSLAKRFYINSRVNNIYGINFTKNESFKIKTPNHLKYSFYDEPDIVIEFNDYIKLDSIEEYFHEFIPSVKVSRNEDKTSFRVYNKYKKRMLGNPAIIINGVLYNDAKYLLSIDPIDCKKIEVVKSKVLIYNKIYFGIVSLYTKNPHMSLELPENAMRIDYKLFDKSIGFKMPELDVNIPDLRNTLYWKPILKLQPTENKKIIFQTSDDKGTYLVKIIGYNTDGSKIEYSQVIIVN